MKIQYLDASECVENVSGRMNCAGYQSDVGSDASGLNRRRERSNERHGPADVSETFVWKENGVMDSSRWLEPPSINDDVSVVANLPQG